MLGAVLSFYACGTCEIGYVFVLLALIGLLLRRRSVKNALLDTVSLAAWVRRLCSTFCAAQRAPATSFRYSAVLRVTAADGRVAP